MSLLWTPHMLAFFLISLFILACAVMMLSFRKVVYMALTVGGIFIGCAALYILLGAEFVGIAQALVYAGAITILILFAIMLTGHEAVEPETKWTLRQAGAALGCGLLGLTLLLIIRSQAWPQGDPTVDVNGGASNTAAIGQALFHSYAVPFELVSLLLIVALVGAVILAQSRKEDE